MIIRLRNGYVFYGKNTVRSTVREKFLDWTNSDPLGKDAHKNVNRRRRHLVVNTLGMAVAAGVQTSGIQDRDRAEPVLKKLALLSGVYGGPRPTLALSPAPCLRSHG